MVIRVYKGEEVAVDIMVVEQEVKVEEGEEAGRLILIRFY